MPNGGVTKATSGVNGVEAWPGLSPRSVTFGSADFWEPPYADPHVRWCGLSITHKYLASLALCLLLEKSDIHLDELLNNFPGLRVISDHFSNLPQPGL